MKKSIVIRLGEPYKHKYRSPYYTKDNTNVFFLQEDDLVFTSIIIDYDRFINDNLIDDLRIFDDLYCNSFKLVEDIDSIIYIREVQTGFGFMEEKWVETKEDELLILKKIVESLEPHKNKIIDQLSFDVKKYYRNNKLKDIGI